MVLLARHATVARGALWCGVGAGARTQRLADQRLGIAAELGQDGVLPLQPTPDGLAADPRYARDGVRRHRKVEDGHVGDPPQAHDGRHW